MTTKDNAHFIKNNFRYEAKKTIFGSFYFIFTQIISNMKLIQPIDKIKLPLFDLTYNKVKKCFTHSVVFYPDYICWTLECVIDILPKPDEGPEAAKTDFLLSQSDYILRNVVGSVETHWCDEHNVWVCSLFFSGSRYVDCKFKDETEMRQLANKLLNWIFGKSETPLKYI